MSVNVYLVVEIDGERVKPTVDITSQPMPWSQGAAMVPRSDMETVRLGMEIANKVLGFAEGLKREP